MAASYQRPTTRTASACTPETARGAHVFRIAGYSLHRGLGAGQSVRSTPFAIGGFDWCVRFYPDGYSSSEDHAGHVAVFLHLLTKNARARASAEFRLIDQATGQSSSSTVPAAAPPLKVTEGTEFGTSRFMERRELETSPYLREDCLVIECDVLVIKEPRVVMEEAATVILAPEFEVQVSPPHSDLSEKLGKILEYKKGTDVTFKVRDELFHAHKIVLAVRSPVFAAEFYGPMAVEDDTTKRPVTIEDMHPDVFRALLHFVYTDDATPVTGDCGGDDGQEIVKHLLVAADRYALERLKLICEAILFKSLNVGNVATTLELADKHHCRNLKEACVQFITSSNRVNNNVVPGQGSMHLNKRVVFPAVLVDMLGNVTKCMHGCFQFLGISRGEDI
ncbi:unnamed protein product [Urochloa humidicola]